MAQNYQQNTSDNQHQAGHVASLQVLTQVKPAEQQREDDLDLTDRTNQGDVGHGEGGEPAGGSAA
jgi:hypothetical protein